MHSPRRHKLGSVFFTAHYSVNAAELQESKPKNVMPQSSKHVDGLDQLRFFMALCVTIGHCNLAPDLRGIVTNETLVGFVLRAIAHNVVNGPAAVIVFFVISGFCIHLPYREKTHPIPYFSYFTRRYVRILAPLAVALLLAKPLNLKLALFQNTILWSLVCEEIYYLLYPLLRVVGSRIGWKTLIAIAFIAAFVVAATNPTVQDYPSFGWQLNWLLGLPCWLLGCLLAEGKHEQPVTMPRLLLWRAIALGSSMSASILCFHSPIKYPFSLNLFAIVAFFWLGQEIAHYRNRAPFQVLERAGKWSYSLYLVHGHAYKAWWFMHLYTLPLILRWPIQLAFILIFSYAFYRLVERPTHGLARSLSARLSRSQPLSSKDRQLFVPDSG